MKKYKIKSLPKAQVGLNNYLIPPKSKEQVIREAQRFGPTVELAQELKELEKKEKKAAAKKAVVKDVPIANVSDATNVVLPNQESLFTPLRDRDLAQERRDAQWQAESEFRKNPDVAKKAGITDEILYDNEGNYDWRAVANVMATPEYNQAKLQNFLDWEQKTYDKLPFYRRWAFNTSAFLDDPILTGGNLMSGKRPMLGQSAWLNDPEEAQKLANRFGISVNDLYELSGENANSINDLVKWVNPGHWGTQSGISLADASTAIDEGRYIDAVGNFGLATADFFDAGALMHIPIGKGMATTFTKTGKRLNNAYNKVARGKSSRGAVGKSDNIYLEYNPVKSEQLSGQSYSIIKDGKPVGSVTGEFSPQGDMRVFDVEIDPQFQKKGIAKEAYRQLNREVPGKVRSYGAYVPDASGNYPGVSLWESLVKEGSAKKVGDSYEMVEDISTIPTVSREKISRDIASQIESIRRMERATIDPDQMPYLLSPEEVIERKGKEFYDYIASKGDNLKFYPFSKNLRRRFGINQGESVKQSTKLLEDVNTKFKNAVEAIIKNEESPLLSRYFNAEEFTDNLNLKVGDRSLGNNYIQGRRTKHFGSPTQEGAVMGDNNYDMMFVSNLDKIKKASGSHLRDPSPGDTYFYNLTDEFILPQDGVFFTSNPKTYEKLYNQGKSVKLVDDVTLANKELGVNADELLDSWQRYYDISGQGSSKGSLIPNFKRNYKSEGFNQYAHGNDILSQLESLSNLGDKYIKQGILNPEKLEQFANLPVKVREAELKKLKDFYEKVVLKSESYDDFFKSNYNDVITTLEKIHKNQGLKGAEFQTGGAIDMELTPKEIQWYTDNGYVVEEINEYQDGGDVISSYGWDYKKEGDQYFTRKTGTEDWITPQGEALQAIKQKIYNEAPYTAQDRRSEYLTNLQNLVAQGYSIDDLVKMGMGTRAGLVSILGSTEYVEPTPVKQTKVAETPVTKNAYWDPARYGNKFAFRGMQNPKFGLDMSSVNEFELSKTPENVVHAKELRKTGKQLTPEEQAAFDINYNPNQSIQDKLIYRQGDQPYGEPEVYSARETMPAANYWNPMFNTYSEAMGELFNPDTSFEVSDSLTKSSLPLANEIDGYNILKQKIKNELASNKPELKIEKIFRNKEQGEELLERQYLDNIYYGRFMNRGNAVANRTGIGRHRDSNILISDIVEKNPNTVVIDIGSGLGNDNPELAGVSLTELPKNVFAKAKVIGTDIPESYERFKMHQKEKQYPFDSYRVPLNFNTPVKDIIDKKAKNSKTVVLRAANSIDLLMTPEEAQKHLEHILKQTFGKEVYYLFNKHILYKDSKSNSFKIIGQINNAGFDHINNSWETNLDRTPYELFEKESLR